MTTLEVLKLNRRLAGPKSAQRGSLLLHTSTDEWKPRFVATPAFPRPKNPGPGRGGPDPQAAVPGAVKVVPWTFGADWPS